jgi:hypothetical protein
MTFLFASTSKGLSPKGRERWEEGRKILSKPIALVCV